MNFTDPFGLSPICAVAPAACVAAAAAALKAGATVARSGAVQRGMNHPAVRAAAQRGQDVHRAFARQMRAAGHQAELVLENTGRRLDALVVEAQSKILTIIELKPGNERTLQRGAAQVAQYADDVAALIHGNVGKWARYSEYAIQRKVLPYP